MSRAQYTNLNPEHISIPDPTPYLLAGGIEDNVVVAGTDFMQMRQFLLLMSVSWQTHERHPTQAKSTVLLGHAAATRCSRLAVVMTTMFGSNNITWSYPFKDEGS